MKTNAKAATIANLHRKASTLLEQMDAQTNARVVEDGIVQYGNRMTADEMAFCRANPGMGLRFIRDVVRLRSPGAVPFPAGLTTQARSGQLDPRIGAEMDRQMGISTSTPRMPKRLADGRFVVHNVRPSELRRMESKCARR